MSEVNYNELSKKIHQQNVDAGWWDDPDQCIYEKLQLVSTEIAEATEGARKDLMDDHLPHLKMEEVELGDTLIRMLDIGGKLGLSLEDNGVFSSEELDKITDSIIDSGFSVGRIHFILNSLLVEFSELIEEDDDDMDLVNNKYTEFVACILAYGNSRLFDVESAMFEKLEYNKQRKDHKRDARQQEGGKKF